MGSVESRWCLYSQHSGGWGRNIKSSRLAWDNTRSFLKPKEQDWRHSSVAQGLLGMPEALGSITRKGLKGVEPSRKRRRHWSRLVPPQALSPFLKDLWQQDYKKWPIALGLSIIQSCELVNFCPLQLPSLWYSLIVAQSRLRQQGISQKVTNFQGNPSKYDTFLAHP